MAYAVGVTLTSNRVIYITPENILLPSIIVPLYLLWRRIIQLSVCNQFSGHVKEVKLGNITAGFIADIGNSHKVVAALTRGSAKRLGFVSGGTVKKKLWNLASPQ